MPHLLHTRAKELTQLHTKLHTAVYRVIAPLQVTGWRTQEPLPFTRRTDGEKFTAHAGQSWGQLWDCAWMRLTGRLPAAAKGHNIVLLIDVGGEACVFNPAGVPVQGLTNIKSEFDLSLGRPGKRVLPFARKGRPGQKIDLWIDAAMNDLFGRMVDGGQLKQADIAICREDLRALAYDYEILEELSHQLPADSARQQQLLRALCDAANLLLPETDLSLAPAPLIARVRDLLRPHLAQHGGDPNLTITAIGHSHMDLAWLWPLRETRRKCARTFSTVLRNFERYPDYVYGASQPQQLEWIREDHPAIFRALQQRAREGRFDCQGGMWVESDTNVPSGESLVRQFVHGIRYWQQHFGVRVRNLWLPDVFGYSGALPQIMEQCGLPWFMTQKLSWNRINKFPHQSFWWQGIDGTRVLAHMLPEETYNAPASPRGVAKAEKNYLDSAVSRHALMLFGIGDGGGGPGEEHLERLAREKNLAGLAPVKQARADQFYAQWKQDAHRFATWQGELYLEYHQGTFTTQARSKQYNRKLERALHDCEWICALADRLAPATAAPAYPHTDLDRIWKEVLLYQFHDILPGSSIKRVYDESLARYAVLLKETEALTAQALKRLCAAQPLPAAQKPRLLVNTLGWDRTVVIQDGPRHLAASVPAAGFAFVDLAQASAAPAPGLTATADSLDNGILSLRFAADGSLASVFDHAARRETLSAPANRFTLWVDGNNAWDFPPHYREAPPQFFNLVASQAAVHGPYAELRQTWQFGHSRIEQIVRLAAGSRRVDFITTVDWHEQNRMLRVAFPTTVHTDQATCEIQFGAIRRPVHRNTSWDAARIEVPCQSWVDLADGGYGVALLNDSKYGYCLLGNTLDLNLLRGTAHPGVAADQAVHQFTYALLPHPGDHIAGGVVQQAHELNNPVREFMPPKSAAQPATPAATRHSWFSLDTADLVLDTLKQADDGKGLIVRLYETHGAAGHARIHVHLPGKGIRKVTRVNCLEEPLTPGSRGEGAPAQDTAVALTRVKDNATLHLTYRPYELITLRLQ